MNDFQIVASSIVDPRARRCFDLDVAVYVIVPVWNIFKFAEE